MLNESPTSANLENNHGFIIKQYYLYWCEAFEEAQSKAMRVYAQSGQYHIIVESRVHLTWYQRIPKEKEVEPRLRGDILCSRGRCWKNLFLRTTAFY